ncbi:MAG: chromosomal replication initiator protein DnaA [bacterium]|nr:chromosomal replication initiator protein DnaA [bacterium]
MQADELWQRALTILQGRLSRASFESLVRPSRAISLEHGVLLVETPNEFARDWFQRNMGPISAALAESGGPDIRLICRVNEGQDGAVPPEELIQVVPANGTRDASGAPTYGTLNPKYTFESFVVGNHSRFAHAAAVAVADKPAKVYNPLFIYGGVGLGKTHLMHAIGHSLLSRNPRTKVAYLSSEKFTNDLIHSIKEDRMAEFRARYRSIDLLMIDDIQFIQGKERTQEEFFHTFNALQEAGKQIILSSDRPPRDIVALEDRLRSRFEWGLLTDIQVPDLETRIAILVMKADSDGLKVDEDVLAYIALNYQNNVRELEGAFIRVMAYASLTNVPASVDLAKQVLGNVVNKPVTLARIQEIVAEHFHLDVSELVSARRTKDLAWARQIAMYLCRDLTDWSLPKIGAEFGGRDHTTVLHAYEKVRLALAADPSLGIQLQHLTAQIRA